MRPVWADIAKATARNRGVMERLEPSMGLPIRREIYLLERLIAELALAS